MNNWYLKRKNKNKNYYNHINKKSKYNDDYEEKINNLIVDYTTIYSNGNEVYFTSRIDTESINYVIKIITRIIYNHNKKNGKHKKLNITYIVDSGGGCVHSILKFVDFINTVRNRNKNITFTSVITGFVASAGTIMCIVANKRLMTPNAYAMIHELSTGNQGKYKHFLSYTSNIKDIHNTLLNIYLERVSLTKDEVEKLLEGETYFTAKKYLEKGFVDDLTDNYYLNYKNSSDDNSSSDESSDDEFSDQEGFLKIQPNKTIPTNSLKSNNEEDSLESDNDNEEDSLESDNDNEEDSLEFDSDNEEDSLESDSDNEEDSEESDSDNEEDSEEYMGTDTYELTSDNEEDSLESDSNNEVGSLEYDSDNFSD